MKDIKDYISESIENVDSNKIGEKIVEYLKNPKFKIVFDTKEPIEEIQKNKYYDKELDACFSNIYDYNRRSNKFFVMKILNGGYPDFETNSKNNQAEITSYSNNTNKRYYFMVVNSKTVYLVYHEREYYGTPNKVGTPYKFKIDL